ncbi:MAG: hypothetical protein ACRCW0_01970 [Clostridium sp.]
MNDDLNNILKGDYKRIIIETDEKNPISIVTISNDDIIVKNGYRVRVVPN